MPYLFGTARSVLGPVRGGHVVGGPSRFVCRRSDRCFCRSVNPDHVRNWIERLDDRQRHDLITGNIRDFTGSFRADGEQYWGELPEFSCYINSRYVADFLGLDPWTADGDPGSDPMDDSGSRPKRSGLFLDRLVHRFFSPRNRAA